MMGFDSGILFVRVIGKVATAPIVASVELGNVFHQYAEGSNVVARDFKVSGETMTAETAQEKTSQWKETNTGTNSGKESRVCGDAARTRMEV